MAKFCAHCGKELDANAAMCLNCGVLVENTNVTTAKNEKKKGLPTWAIVLIVVGCFTLLPLILIVLIAVMAFIVIDDNDINNIEDYLEESIVQKGTISDTLRTDDYKITLVDALMYDQIGSNEYIEVPKEGKEYLVFFFNVENISGESQYISSYDFSGYVDGYTISSEFLYNDIDGVGELGADLAIGMKTKGYIAYEVDTTWQKFEIHFSDWFDDEELVFTVVNEPTNNTQGA